MKHFDTQDLRLRYDELSHAEYLVGFGFRCWFSGYQNNDISCWGAGWRRFSEDLGVAKAKPVITDLAFWVQNVKNAAHRTIDCAPIDCKAFCQDECMAISLIAASQHQACPALQACARALLGTDDSQDIDDVLHATEQFAYTLEYADIHLTKTHLVN